MAGHSEDDRQHAAPDRQRRSLLRGLAVLLTLPLLRFSALAPLAMAERTTAAAPDFSEVTTRAAALRLVGQGRLVEITLFPVELGGPDEPDNISYTTPEAADARAIVIGTLSRFLDEDLIDRLRIEPDYKGDSIVPSRIAMTATHSRRKGSFGTTIEVW